MSLGYPVKSGTISITFHSWLVVDILDTSVALSAYHNSLFLHRPIDPIPVIRNSVQPKKKKIV